MRMRRRRISQRSLSLGEEGYLPLYQNARLLLGAVLPPTAPPASVTMSIATGNAFVYAGSFAAIWPYYDLRIRDNDLKNEG
ncbi:hypothetical protein V1477_005121 [Vespula maculifrons]|uniref:Uncharacterized protein n=2 Tax=Vespula TaxID=7451 RepID=A0A834NLF3_VESGE|nr:hypothetical protein HZH68_002356 [Vespula germanica]